MSKCPAASLARAHPNLCQENKMSTELKTLPLSEGYLLVDSRICQGCQSCMMVCSLVHEGEANFSLSRIQVMQDILRNWPDDIKIVQCRQCANPLCVEACPFTPSRIVWHPGMGKAVKCDLCLNTPYWDETGGTDSKQACVEVCPQKAVKFTSTVPNQRGDAGYDLNVSDEVER